MQVKAASKSPDPFDLILMAKTESLDAPAHETLEGVYREFRRKVPQGKRFAIWVGCDLHPKTFRPQEFIALDSQLCDKAFAGDSVKK